MCWLLTFNLGQFGVANQIVVVSKSVGKIQIPTTKSDFDSSPIQLKQRFRFKSGYFRSKLGYFHLKFVLFELNG